MNHNNHFIKSNHFGKNFLDDSNREHRNLRDDDPNQVNSLVTTTNNRNQTLPFSKHHSPLPFLTKKTNISNSSISQNNVQTKLNHHPTIQSSNRDHHLHNRYFHQMGRESENHEQIIDLTENDSQDEAEQDDNDVILVSSENGTENSFHTYPHQQQHLRSEKEFRFKSLLSNREHDITLHQNDRYHNNSPILMGNSPSENNSLKINSPTKKSSYDASIQQKLDQLSNLTKNLPCADLAGSNLDKISPLYDPHLRISNEEDGLLIDSNDDDDIVIVNENTSALKKRQSFCPTYPYRNDNNTISSSSSKIHQSDSQNVTVSHINGMQAQNNLHNSASSFQYRSRPSQNAAVQTSSPFFPNNQNVNVNFRSQTAQNTFNHNSQSQMKDTNRLPFRDFFPSHQHPLKHGPNSSDYLNQLADNHSRTSIDVRNKSPRPSQDYNQLFIDEFCSLSNHFDVSWNNPSNSIHTSYMGQRRKNKSIFNHSNTHHRRNTISSSPLIHNDMNQHRLELSPSNQISERPNFRPRNAFHDRHNARRRREFVSTGIGSRPKQSISFEPFTTWDTNDVARANRRSSNRNNSSITRFSQDALNIINVFQQLSERNSTSSHGYSNSNVRTRHSEHQELNSINSFEELSSLSETIGNVSNPTSALIIKNLPEFRYNGLSDTVPARDDENEGTEDRQNECVICLAEYEKGDLLKMLPCLHKFHKECIEKWLLKSHHCPLCRTEVR